MDTNEPIDCDYCWRDHYEDDIRCVDCGTESIAGAPGVWCPWWCPLCMEVQIRHADEAYIQWALDDMENELSERSWAEGWAA